MNVWLVAATILLTGTIPCALVVLRAPEVDALVGLELCGTVVVLVLVLLAEGFERPSYFVLPLVLAALSFAGALVFARYLAAWR